VTPRSLDPLTGVRRPPPWNHNIHYGRQILRSVPAGAQAALDVGCGEGWLTRELAELVPRVVGLDPDRASLDCARSQAPPAGVEYLAGDLLTFPFEPESFDFVACISALHHMDERAGLARMADLLRPAGVLAVVGVARSRLPQDLPWEIAGAVSTRLHKLTKAYWETPAPKLWPPPSSYGEIERLAAAVLPGSQYRRRALWRYVITWTKQPSGG